MVFGHTSPTGSQRFDPISWRRHSSVTWNRFPLKKITDWLACLSPLWKRVLEYSLCILNLAGRPTYTLLMLRKTIALIHNITKQLSLDYDQSEAVILQVKRAKRISVNNKKCGGKNKTNAIASKLERSRKKWVCWSFTIYKFHDMARCT